MATTTGERRDNRTMWLIIALVAIIAIVGLFFMLNRNSDAGEDAAGATTAVSTTVTEGAGDAAGATGDALGGAAEATADAAGNAADATADAAGDAAQATENAADRATD